MLPFESQTVVIQLFDFHLRKFKKFIIIKVLLPQSHVNIGAKSKFFQLKILSEGQWWEQNPAIHRFRDFFGQGNSGNYFFGSLIYSQIRCIALRVCKLRMGFSVPSITWVGAELMQITIQSTRLAWPAKTKLRMTLDCLRIAKEIAMMSGLLVKEN